MSIPLTKIEKTHKTLNREEINIFFVVFQNNFLVINFFIDILIRTQSIKNLE